MRAMAHGISNSNYELTTASSQYVLKISNDKEVHQLKEEFHILSYLEKQKYPYAVCPLSTEDGELYFELEDMNGCLFPFVKGSAPELTKANIKTFAKGLAQLHLVEPNHSIRDYQKVSYGVERIKDYLAAAPQPLFADFATSTLGDRLLQTLSQLSFSTGLIHGDLYFDNSLFVNNELSTFLDFEQAGLGPFIFDIGVSISGSCLDSRTGKISESLIHAFIEGYESARPLDPIERQFLKEFILVGLFSISLWRIKRFTEGNLDSSKKQSFVELLQRAESFKEEINLDV